MEHSTKKLGMMFTLGGWILGFLLLGLVFSKILDFRNNPNQFVSSEAGPGYSDIVLKRNPSGHYLFTGEINGRKVTFLVDTGATTTAIPASLKNDLGLQAGPAFDVSTANGIATAYLTRIDELKMGDMLLRDVSASLNPGMHGNEVLLGMNILKHLELIQKNDELVIRFPDRTRQ